MNNLVKKLNITDLLVVVFFVFLSLLNLIFHQKLDYWNLSLLENIIIIFFVFGIAYLDSKNSGMIINQIHYWYIAPLILITFKEVYLLIKPLRPADFDYILIAADRFIFGTDPTKVLLKIANPLLTEILQICYSSFYFLPMILGVNLMLKNRKMELNFMVFSIVYGFYLSYLGYFLLPAIGPRFTLHNFYDLNRDLPGLFLTNMLREMVNLGESITSTLPHAADIVQRDVFPSGHTQMTLITMFLALKFNAKTKYILLTAGSLLIFATVYLRYHYVIDVLGGIIFFIITMLTARSIFNWWQRCQKQEEFNYIQRFGRRFE